MRGNSTPSRYDASTTRALPHTPPGAQFHPRYARRQGEGLATFLGLFSVGLGLMQLTAPDTVTRLVGARPTDRSRRTMRGLGARELSNGMAILSRPRSPEWLWSRVVGDTMDLTLLSRVYSSSDSHRGRTIAATAAVLGVAYLPLGFRFWRRYAVSPSAYRPWTLGGLQGTLFALAPLSSATW